MNYNTNMGNCIKIIRRSRRMKAELIKKEGNKVNFKITVDSKSFDVAVDKEL